MSRYRSVSLCALTVASLLAASSAVLASGVYIPGNKFDYLINGLRNPGSYYGPSSSGQYVAPNPYVPAQPPYASGYYGTPQIDPSAALIELRVPANAEVWFSGDRTTQQGSVRDFVTPALERGHHYSYEIKVRWLDSKGQPIEKHKKVPVRPGDRLNLQFD
jgi:uncharacterized protein (TIGR03000 family)